MEIFRKLEIQALINIRQILTERLDYGIKHESCLYVNVILDAR